VFLGRLTGFLSSSQALFGEGSSGAEMDRPVALVLYAVAMIAVIVGVELTFFRNLFWEG
jgi:hypothetical protein